MEQLPAAAPPPAGNEVPVQIDFLDLEQKYRLDGGVTVSIHHK